MSTSTDLNVATPAKSGRKRKLRRLLIISGLGLIVVLVAGYFYLNSDSFRETVRQRVILELRQMTGGKVEVESFTWKLSTLHFEARNVTIHGREARRSPLRPCGPHWR